MCRRSMFDVSATGAQQRDDPGTGDVLSGDGGTYCQSPGGRTLSSAAASAVDLGQQELWSSSRSEPSNRYSELSQLLCFQR